MADLAVSLYLPADTSAPTSHTFGLRPTYVSKEGDFTASADIPELADTTQSYYWLAGVDVLAPASAGTIVTFGDSITDGDQSTPDTNGMWPRLLSARLQARPAGRALGVVNAGISGNRILGDNNSGLARGWCRMRSACRASRGSRCSRGSTTSPRDAHPAAGAVAAAGVLRRRSDRRVPAGDRAGAPAGREGHRLHPDAVRRVERLHEGGGVNPPEDQCLDADERRVRRGRSTSMPRRRDPRRSQTRFRAEADSPDMLHPGDCGLQDDGGRVRPGRLPRTAAKPGGDPARRMATEQVP